MYFLKSLKQNLVPRVSLPASHKAVPCPPGPSGPEADPLCGRGMCCMGGGGPGRAPSPAVSRRGSSRHGCRVGPPLLGLLQPPPRPGLFPKPVPLLPPGSGPDPTPLCAGGRPIFSCPTLASRRARCSRGHAGRVRSNIHAQRGAQTTPLRSKTPLRQPDVPAQHHVREPSKAHSLHPAPQPARLPARRARGPGFTFAGQGAQNPRGKGRPRASAGCVSDS